MGFKDVLIEQLFVGIPQVVLALYRDRTGIAQKQLRLDMLVTKIRSVLETSEKVEITNQNLCRWQQIFKDAATKGEEVLQQLQDHEANSSSSSSGTFFERLLSKKDDMDKLNNTIKWLEQISAEVKDFLRTLKLEVDELLKPRNPKKDEKNEDKGDEGRAFKPAEQMETYPVPLATPSFLSCKRRRAFPQRMTNNTPEASKESKAQPSTSVSTQKLEADAADTDAMIMGLDESMLLLGANTEHPYTDTEELKGVLVCDSGKMNMGVKSTSMPEACSLLARRRNEEVTAVKRLAGRIQVAVYMAKQNGEHGSWFSQWIAKLEEAVKEGNTVVSALQSYNFCVNDQISNEVGEILTAVRLRLESILLYDLEDFKNAVRIETQARELTVIADKK